ncbi:hypothetical protein LSH36_463g04044, partial [Paralvinella palmiformis]
YTLYGNGSLVIRSVVPWDAGGYTCLGVSENSLDQSFMSILQIAYLNELIEESFQPRPGPGFMPLVVPEDKKLEVLCLMPDGLPTPTQSLPEFRAWLAAVFFPKSENDFFSKVVLIFRRFYPHFFRYSAGAIVSWKITIYVSLRATIGRPYSSASKEHLSALYVLCSERHRPGGCRSGRSVSVKNSRRSVYSRRVHSEMLTAEDGDSDDVGWEDHRGAVIPTDGHIKADSGLLTLTNARQEDSVPPSWKEPPLSERIMEGKSVSFSCLYYGTPYPVTTILWKKGGFPIDLSHPRYSVDQARKTLTIQDVHLVDEDDYVCVVNTTGQPLLISANAHLYVESYGRKGLVDTHAALGIRMRLYDLASDELTLMITLLDNANWLYLRFFSENVGAQLISLQQFSVLTILSERLKFKPNPINTKLELGSNSKVHCRADARSPPIIRWKKDDAYVFPKHIVDVDGTLFFNGVRYSDEGNYTCIAQTETEKINVTISVEVVVKPHFTVKPKNTTAYEGYPAILHCVAEGNPTPNIEWDKNNVVNGFNKERFRTLPNGSLYVVETYLDDVGKYGCTAGNSGGFQREEVYLHVATVLYDDSKDSCAVINIHNIPSFLH